MTLLFSFHQPSAEILVKDALHESLVFQPFLLRAFLYLVQLCFFHSDVHFRFSSDMLPRRAAEFALLLLRWWLELSCVHPVDRFHRLLFFLIDVLWIILLHVLLRSEGT